MIEIELRYKTNDPAGLTQKLADAGITVAGKQHVIDRWFAPTSVRNMTQEKQWFDVDHGVAYRIRQVEQADGSFKTVLGSKQLTSANNHDTFKEMPPEEMSLADATERLAQKDYRCWLAIDKTRTTFTSPEDDQFEIVLDEIAGMQEKIGVAAGLEIEYKGQTTREDALAKLGAFAAKLGLQESDRFDKSLTVAAMDVLANFKD